MGRTLSAFALAAAGLLAQRDQPPAVAGAALFQRSCAACHDVEGRAPSLSSGMFTHGGEDAQIAQTIRAGVPGTQMPAFPQLSSEAVSELVAYIRGRAANTAPVASPAATTSPGSGVNLTYERLLRSSAASRTTCSTYWGDYQGTHYSSADADHHVERRAGCRLRGRGNCPAAPCSRRHRWWSTA